MRKYIAQQIRPSETVKLQNSISVFKALAVLSIVFASACSTPATFIASDESSEALELELENDIDKLFPDPNPKKVHPIWITDQKPLPNDDSTLTESPDLESEPTLTEYSRLGSDYETVTKANATLAIMQVRASAGHPSAVGPSSHEHQDLPTSIGVADWSGDPTCVICQPGSSPYHPEDEYICDGGDREISVKVETNRNIRGLQLEDTVGHFDTLDGQTMVEPSNRVCLYAPRFAAVLKVTGAFESDRFTEPIRVATPVEALTENHDQRTLATANPIAAKHDVGIGTALTFKDRTAGITLNNYVPVREFSDAIQAHLDFQFVRIGVLKRSEKARLAEQSEAAEVWTKNASAEVILDDIPAVIDTTVESPGVVFANDDSGSSRLRLVKIASTDSALPGEEVEFILRFDNTGDQPIANVTIVDNLTTRLEYVEDSAECTIDAKFDSELNVGESLKLRWEIKQPLKPGEGGVIRLKCKVR